MRLSGDVMRTKLTLPIWGQMREAYERGDHQAAHDAIAEHTRKCGTCTYCCTTIGIEGKPAGTACQHEIRGRGCAINDTKPDQCKHYFCLWKIGFGNSKDSPRETGIIVDGGSDNDGKDILRVFEVWNGALREGTRAFQFVQSLIRPPARAIVFFFKDGHVERHEIA